MSAKMLAMFFVGMSIGSLNPADTAYGWLIPLAIATVFMIIEMSNDYKRIRK